MRLLVLALVMIGQACWAAGPENSKRPVQRGGNVYPAALAVGVAVAPIMPIGTHEKLLLDNGLSSSVRPLFRPARVEKMPARKNASSRKARFVVILPFKAKISAG